MPRNINSGTPSTVPNRINRTRFEQLYRLHWKQLRDYCHYHTQDRYLAEEMVQDIFLSVWERRAAIGSIDEGFIKYLTRAAKLKLFDFHRHCAVIKRHTQRECPLSCEACHSTEQALYYKELAENIDRFIHSLPCNCREVYRLIHEEGLSKEAAAQMLNLSPKAVEYHLYKVRHLIRDRITRYKED